MKIKNIIAITVLSLGALLGGVFSCTKDKTPAPAVPCDPSVTYFQNEVLPIIASSCAKSGCHDAATKADGYNLTTYAGIMKIVKAGNPSSSDLIEVITASGKDIMPPAPNAPLTQQQIDLISKWIREGAKDLRCTQDSSSCGSGTVTYSNDITKIISGSCLGCHSGSTINGNVNLSTHAGVQAVAKSGKLYNSVTQNGQAVAMPPSVKLGTCEVKKIKSWVDAGALNN